MLAYVVLRRAAIEALCPSDAAPVTIAQDRVYDSRIHPIDSLFGEAAKPTICLYTEEVDAAPGSATNGIPHRPTVSFVIEMSVRVAVRGDATGDQVDILVAESDALAEAQLDLLGSQVYRRLVLDPPQAFRRARVQVPKYSSVALRDSEGGKLAIRALALSVDLPAYSSPAAEIAIARAVHDLLPEASEGRAVITQAITLLEPPPADPPPPPAALDIVVRPGSAQPGTPDIVAALVLANS